MSLARMVLKEMRLRWGNALLSVVAVAAAVGVFVMLLTLGIGLEREMAQVVRELGFNILIFPKEADLAKFWVEGYIEAEMPEEYVDRLANTPGLYADHFVALLRKRIEVQGREFLLVGWQKEKRAIDYLRKKKRPMGFRIPKGTAYVGYEVARALGLREGDWLNLGGLKFKVTRVLQQVGGPEDVSIFIPLHEAQKVVGRPGRISMIKALNCLCFVRGELVSPMELTVRKIEEALPDVRAVPIESLAKVRLEARRTVMKWIGVVLPIVLVVCAAWVGVLGLMNVQERREEIGILRALGFGSGKIASLFLGRAALLGVLGAAIGFAVGTWLALHYGPGLFKITFAKLKPSYRLLFWSLVGAPLVTGVASLPSTALAVSQDPAEVLKRG